MWAGASVAKRTSGRIRCSRSLRPEIIRRPVRIQLTRAQMYSMVGHQPATIQTITLAADKTGKLTGIRHDSISPTSVFDDYIEYAANASRSLCGRKRWHIDGTQNSSHQPQYAHGDARTARGARARGDRDRDGRAGVCLGGGSRRPAPSQRYACGSVHRPTVLYARHASLPDRGCAALWVERPQPSPALHARWSATLSDRAWLVPSTLTGDGLQRRVSC